MEFTFFRSRNLGKNNKYNWYCRVRGGVIFADGDMEPAAVIEALNQGNFSTLNGVDRETGEPSLSIMVGFGSAVTVRADLKLAKPNPISLPDIGLVV